jgi:lysozyme
MTPHLFNDLQRDEGLRLAAYQDGGGRWTIGYGHAEGVAEDDVWTEDQAMSALHVDVAAAVAQLDKAFPWWRSLDEVRQDVMVELAFNMGIGTLSTFHNTLGFIRDHEFHQASAALLMSRWASQVGERAARLASMMKTGERP